VRPNRRNVALSHGYRSFMADRRRVWEVAEELDVASPEVIAALRERGEWVTSHLSTVPGTVLDELRRTLRPVAAATQPPTDPTTGTTTTGIATPATPTPRRADGPALRPGTNPFHRPPEPPGQRRRPRPAPPRRRRPPGPAPVTYEGAWEPDPYDGDLYIDPRADLRYQPVLSTRDVAALCEVSPACVRQWVTRGYLTPIGRNGPSAIFETTAVLATAHDVGRRRKPRGTPADRTTPRVAPPGVTNPGTPVSTVELHRLARVYPNLVLDTAGAAGLLGVKTATIRSWVHRGHLRPLPTSTPRSLDFRFTDLLRTLGHRHI
jgi:hypothetical protein